MLSNFFSPIMYIFRETESPCCISPLTKLKSRDLEGYGQYV